MKTSFRYALGVYIKLEKENFIIETVLKLKSQNGVIVCLDLKKKHYVIVEDHGSYNTQSIRLIFMSRNRYFKNHVSTKNLLDGHTQMAPYSFPNIALQM